MRSPGLLGEKQMKPAAPSATSKLFAVAMANRKQILCLYDGHPRAVCPIILGHTRGEETALVFQFAGGSRSGLPADGDWKCLHLAKTRAVELRDGPWHAGARHRQAQSCVGTVDLDINPRSPYKPRR